MYLDRCGKAEDERGGFPLTFLSNVLVDPRTLPGPLEAFVEGNPVSRLVTASRGVMAGPRRGGAGDGRGAGPHVRAAHDVAVPEWLRAAPSGVRRPRP